MGFLNGRVTYTRYRVGGDSPLPFGEDLLELAEQHAIGKHGAADPTDGVAIGWAGGDHVLDLTLRPGQERRQRRPPPGDPGRHRQDPRLAAAGVHPDRDRRPGPAQPERVRRPRPSGRRPRRPPGSAPRPRRPTAGSAGCNHYPVLWDGQTERPLRRDHQHHRPRPAPDPLPRDVRPHARADHRRQPGLLAWPRRRGQERSVEDFGPVGFVGEDASSSTVAWSEDDPSQPRLLGQRVPALALAHPPGRRRHRHAARRLGGDRDGRQDPDPRLPPRRDRPRQPDQRGPDPAPRGLPRPPGGQAPAQGRPDRRPPRRRSTS